MTSQKFALQAGEIEGDELSNVEDLECGDVASMNELTSKIEY